VPAFPEGSVRLKPWRQTFTTFTLRSLLPANGIQGPFMHYDGVAGPVSLPDGGSYEWFLGLGTMLTAGSERSVIYNGTIPKPISMRKGHGVTVAGLQSSALDALSFPNRFATEHP
jgi:hypothetical protein